MSAEFVTGIVILHDAVDACAGPDAQDTLVQVNSVCAALIRLGFDPVTLAVSADIKALHRELVRLRPDLVFNLVESAPGLGHYIDRVPRLLDELAIPYTGSSAKVLRQTSDKLHAKQIMDWYAMPTPALWDGRDGGRWIVKSAWEHASLGMDDTCVVRGDEAEASIADRQYRLGGVWFAERYIEGREVNVSLLEGANGPQVLAVAEIDFVDYSPGKPRIVGYAAKWLQGSFEYHNTPRRFLDDESERPLRENLIGLALRCWETFGLKGYVRIDARVEDSGKPWLLEINANPCLSPDAGFAAAIDYAGLDYDVAIARIVASAGAGFRTPGVAPGVAAPV